MTLSKPALPPFKLIKLYMGGDGIPPIILREAATAVLEPLHHLFLLCVQQSTSY